MFAKSQGGQFILRIEDTDQKRFDPTALQTLMEALRWVGLDWDEGPEVGGEFAPYVQSERLSHYQHWAHELVKQGKAYKCFCTPERLEAVNREKQLLRQPPGYDRHCRYLSPEEVADKEASGMPYVIRFKMPLEGKTEAHDLLRGVVTFENDTLQDAVLLKSDGFPTYHLAVVVDDHLMRISHVLRANEWLPSYPLHVQIWQAFGWDMPVFVHLPVMLNPNGKGKMSKRNPPKDQYGNIVPVMVHDYMQAGYLPEAMLNFLAGVGWTFGDDQELFTMQEAFARFKLEDINPNNSALPAEKLDFLNGNWIRHIAPDDLANRLRPFLEREGYTVDDRILHAIAPVVQTRLKVLSDIGGLAGFLFKDPATFVPAPPDVLIQKKMDAQSSIDVLEKSIALIESLPEFTTPALLEAFSAKTGEWGVNNSQLFGVLRVAVSAQKISTPTFETMEVLGKEESLRRIRLSIEALRKG
jgi:glutamyl-tRNA synthetase